MNLIKILLAGLYLMVLQLTILLMIPIIIIFYIYCYFKNKKHGKEKN
jgi:Na+-transporting methylmalonyl-CoA/oxaloacetate decarboxylase gamma subunit